MVRRSRRFSVKPTPIFLGLILSGFCPLAGLGFEGTPLVHSPPVDRPWLAPDTVIAWTVHEDPVASVGRQEGPEEQILYNVFDATVLEDGTLVVILYLRGFFEIRYYGPEGDFLAKAGRFGPGPFEVDAAGPIGADRISGDSILVWSADHRFSVLGPRGEHGRSGRFRIGAYFHRAHILDRKNVVFEKWSMGTAAPGKVGREQADYFSFDVESEELVELGGGPVNLVRINDSGRGGFEVPFGPRGYAAGGPGWFWFGNGAEDKITGFSSANGGKTILEPGLLRRAVSRTDIEEFKDFDLLGTDGDEARRIRAQHKQAPFPDSFPFFQGLETDRDGNIWVQAYEPRGSKADYVWDVFQPDGRQVGTLTIPFDLLDSCVRDRAVRACRRALEFGEDYVLVENRDDLGVIRIKIYRLTKKD